MKKTTARMMILGLLALTMISTFHGGNRAFAQKDYLQIGFDLMKSETIGALAVGLSDSDVLSTMGPADQKSVPKIWAADGNEHQKWNYVAKGVELGMMVRNRETRQVVDRISIVNPCSFLTKKGIGIGSTLQEVQLAYRNEINPEFSGNNSTLVAGSVYGGIIFSLKEGIVAKIFIGSAAE